MESNSKLKQTNTKIIELEKKRAFIDRLRKLQKEHNLSDDFVEDFSEIEEAFDLTDEEILGLNEIFGQFELASGLTLEELCFGEESQDLYE
jgi:hypothetical protein